METVEDTKSYVKLVLDEKEILQKKFGAENEKNLSMICIM